MSALTVTFDSEISIVTTIKELARLRRVEQAARGVLPLFDNDGPLVTVYKTEGETLRAALDAK